MKGNIDFTALFPATERNLQEGVISIRMKYHDIEISREAVADLCERHHIRRLALFGSILRDDFSDDSDVDVLVIFETGKTPGFAFIDIQDELSQLLGRPVDLHTPASLSKYFREQVIEEAKPLYDAA